MEIAFVGSSTEWEKPVDGISHLIEQLRSICEADTPSFIGIFLDDQSRNKLLELVPPIYPNVTADHVTVIHNPTEEDLAKYKKKFGKRVVLIVPTMNSNERIQAVTVKNIKVASGVPHITISSLPYVKQSESKDLLAADKGVPIQPWLKLNGVYGLG